eukprot:TRINITY_DN2861_c1_g2_i1.p1 TRINITY_DN2861_c1_g2~~TRINITY_DN2861_c1_g2_i1.p1  ORF type:complete len:508 (-),score=87.02 TRINITY_DN2861_c1_g2_i1:310-1704(-)
MQLKSSLEKYGQQHLLQDWDKLDEVQREELKQEVEGLDLEFLQRIFKTSTQTTPVNLDVPESVENVNQISNRTEEQYLQWYNVGLQTIAQGKLGVLLLAGGQGTRLGSPLPKGCYNIGLPSNKSLFHLQAERVLKVQRLAADACNHGNVAKPLMWYVMTSPFTHNQTIAHFESNKYFGLCKDQVFFFQQGFLPCFTKEGAFIMSSSSQLCKAPDGNGGVYRALSTSGALQNMIQNGIQCLDCYCVDNALAKLADPAFVGFCIQQQAQCGARVVCKAYPEEKVGVFAKRGSGLHVVEYSELDPQEAVAVDSSSGQLKFNWGNICMHYFSVQWLQEVLQSLEEMGQYHVANKKISSKDGSVEGIKLEMFIFDTFPLAQQVALFEVDRNEEFAPVKNAPGSDKDSPDTALRATLTLQKKWVENAGGKVTVDPGAEISPLVSYAGEGLASICKDQLFNNVFEEKLQIS